MGARNESGKTWLFNYSFDYDSRRNERWLMEIIDTIMKNQQLIWKKVIFSSGIIFQILFMLEIVLFSNIIIIDPSVHKISYENWIFYIQQWQSPDFWSLHSQLIVNSTLIINLIFRLIYDVELIYIFLNSKHFALNRKAFVIAIILICFLNVLISLYIKYYVDFYRLYMYSIYPETMACYMIYCGKKSYCHINEHK